MRISFDHPAVVSGTSDNGGIRRELVRVSSDFEIKELSDRDAPRSFTVNVDGTPLHEFRTVGGRHYKKWILDKPKDVLVPGSNLMNSIYTGGNLDFPVLNDVLKAEIRETRKNPLPAHIENTERTVLKREKNAGFDSRAVAMMKAPPLRRWRWLGPDTDAEVADWRGRTANVFDRIILVDGNFYTHSYEPVYRLNANGSSSHAMGRASGLLARGLAELVPHDMAVYGDTLKDRRTDGSTGLEELGYLALLLGDQYFAANDTDGIAEFAEASGWGLKQTGQTIVVHDDVEPSGDFLELETVRHARLVYDGARVMVAQVRGANPAECQYAGRKVNKLAMERKMESLRRAIVAWQDERRGTDGLAAPFEDLFAEIGAWEDGNPKRNRFDLFDQVQAFKIREDMAEVTVVPGRWNTPAP
ncbi:hypothetical protein O9X98_06350 [Agrobacterium salinitolerans]|nr:hypothetical protein [Agrobacterium salinitolerans]